MQKFQNCEDIERVQEIPTGHYRIFDTDCHNFFFFKGLKEILESFYVISGSLKYLFHFLFLIFSWILAFIYFL